MKKGRSKPERLLEEIIKLDHVQFFGICKILDIKIFKDEEKGKDAEPKTFYELWSEMCDVINDMNRTRRRNLAKLVYAATKEEKEE